MPAVTCPACATPLDIPDDLIGRAVRCGNCNKPFEALPNAPAGAAFPAAGIAKNPLTPQSPVTTRAFDEPERYDDYRGIRRDLAPHRGTLVLVFGIISLAMLPIACLCQFLNLVSAGLGIAAWIMGRSDLNAMDSGSMDPDGRGQTKAGVICGIIGTILAFLMVVAYVAYLIFIFAVMAKQGNF